MASAAKAKPVVLAVGDADDGGSDADGSAGGAEDGAGVSEGEAAGLAGLTTLDPHAAASSAAATISEVSLR
jgi:hypothetical protein